MVIILEYFAPLKPNSLFSWVVSCLLLWASLFKLHYVVKCCTYPVYPCGGASPFLSSESVWDGRSNFSSVRITWSLVFFLWVHKELWPSIFQKNCHIQYFWLSSNRWKPWIPTIGRQSKICTSDIFISTISLNGDNTWVPTCFINSGYDDYVIPCHDSWSWCNLITDTSMSNC